MPSFTSRHYTPHRWQAFSTHDDDNDDDDDEKNNNNDMEGITYTASNSKFARSKAKRSLAVDPSADALLLDHVNLPSPPSTPRRHRPSSQRYSSVYNPSDSPPNTPGRSPSSSTSSLGSNAASPSVPGLSFSATSTPPTPSLPRWPTSSQRISRLPTRSRARGTSSRPTSPTRVEDADVEMTGTTDGGTIPLLTGAPPLTPVIRQSRRTPYYPPNSSRNVDRTRVYMSRGPHYMQNWTPLSSLPRHVQLRIEESMVKFTA
ncbi:hypothetical protein VTJ83DRAFT_6104 [Remersonia thermophila]|uniref:Uncharacterized protein n=1 Tax=Remersonia thermophila TaxID=72144 RepID=A0ABR4D8R1_9PEZI